MTVLRVVTENGRQVPREDFRPLSPLDEIFTFNFTEESEYFPIELFPIVFVHLIGLWLRHDCWRIYLHPVFRIVNFAQLHQQFGHNSLSCLTVSLRR